MFKGLGNLGDMGKMMKAAQDMQTKMAEMQDALDQITVTGESGAGLVKATATAKGELTSLDIDPSIFQPSEKEVVEDLILAAQSITPMAQRDAEGVAEIREFCKDRATPVSRLVTASANAPGGRQHRNVDLS